MTFLGTAGAIPTVERGPSALLITRGGERILVDCGEGTQRQLMRSVGMSRIGKILLTHLHGDHYLGLPGLLKTLSLQGREDSLDIFGPPGLEEFFRVSRPIFGHPQFEINVAEVTGGCVFEGGGYRLCAQPTDHGMPSVAWSLEEAERPGRFYPDRAVELGVEPGPDFGRLQQGMTVVTSSGKEVEPSRVMDEPRPGRKIVVTGDTRPTEELEAFARGATVLVHDATFVSAEDARAVETKHSTAKEASITASRAGADLLVLVHLSSRYSHRHLEKEATRLFPYSVVPDDFDQVIVPYPDKGRPSLAKGAVKER